MTGRQDDSDPLLDLLVSPIADERNAAAGPQKSETGVVTSVSPLLVNCSGSDESVILAARYTPAVGDLVVLLRARGVTIALDKIGTGVAPSAPIPDPVAGSNLFAAAETWSWRDGRDFAYQQDVRQGAQDGSGSWTGAWFYQGVPGATLAGVTVTGCSVKVARASGGLAGSQPAHLYLSSTGLWPTTDLTPPTTTGTVTNVSLLPGDSTWATLPTAWGQTLIDTDAGLMVYGASPQVFLAGRDTDPESGLLQIDWERI